MRIGSVLFLDVRMEGEAQDPSDVTKGFVSGYCWASGNFAALSVAGCRVYGYRR